MLLYMFCREVCRENTPGRTYIGQLNTTETGRVCQQWSSNTPHTVYASFTDNGFPDGNSEAAENYCRNPDKDWLDGVWCYTTDPNMRWDSCDVPECGESALFLCSLQPHPCSLLLVARSNKMWPDKFQANYSCFIFLVSK